MCSFIRVVLALILIQASWALGIPTAAADVTGCGGTIAGGFFRPSSDACGFHCHEGRGVSAYARSQDSGASVAAHGWCNTDTYVDASCSGSPTCTAVTPPGVTATQQQSATCYAEVQDPYWPNEWDYWCSNAVYYSSSAAASGPGVVCVEIPLGCILDGSYVHGLYVQGAASAVACVVEMGVPTCATIPVACMRSGEKIACLVTNE